MKRASTAGKTLVPIISWSAVRSVFLILAVKERSLQTDRNMRWVTKTVCTLPREQKKFTLKVKMLPIRAKFYMVSAPAHTYTTTFIPIEKGSKETMCEAALSNKRVINQFIHPDVLKTCQLSMGMTVLEPGSVWNTMPAHTERRMEVYMYFEVPGDNVVFHMMGEPTETRHIVMKNEEAVISPSWSIHSGAGTSYNLSGQWAAKTWNLMIWTP